MKKKVAGAMCTALLAMGLYAPSALAAEVTVTLPTFPVVLNGVTMEQTKSQYPLLVYKDITYVPMTWADTRLLGLESNWTQQAGLTISKAAVVQDAKTAQSAYAPYKSDTANAKSYTAATASGKITVNGTAITNSKEEYPLLVFRDVTYFPLTWRFAVNEFGWDYQFSQKNGLVITPKATSAITVNTKGDIIGQKVAVTASNVNLRADAGTSGAAVGTAQKGEELIVLGTAQVDGKEWYQVMRTSGGDKLWIASWYTEKSGGSTVQPSTNNNNNNTLSGLEPNGNITASPSSMVGKTVVVTSSTVNLRASTSTSSAVIGQATQGETFTVLAEKIAGSETWYQITAKTGVKAWIAGWLVQERSNANNQNSNQNNNQVVNENYEMVGRTVAVNSSGVNLRKEPGTNSAVTATTSKGTEYVVLTLKTVNGEVWYQVQHNGSKVWIASWLVDKVNKTNNSSSSNATNNSVSTGVQTRLTLQGVQQQGSKTIITLKHGQGNAYSTVKSNANELVLQLDNVYLNTSDSINEGYSAGPVQRLQVQDGSSNSLKVSLTLQKGAYCTVKEKGDDLIITAYNQHELGEQGLAGKVIVIDPGHGGSDPGAIGKVLGVTDANVGLTVGQKLRDLLQAQGATVIMTRDTDVRVGLNDRPEMANAVEADLFVSIHANSATRATASGIQVYYYAPSTNANLYAQSYIRKELATQVSKGMQSTTGTTSTVMTANYAVLRENDRPSILVETGFLSNQAEEALLATDEYRQKLANGIYQGIRNYLSQY